MERKRGKEDLPSSLACRGQMQSKHLSFPLPPPAHTFPEAQSAPLRSFISSAAQSSDDDVDQGALSSGVQRAFIVRTLKEKLLWALKASLLVRHYLVNPLLSLHIECSGYYYYVLPLPPTSFHHARRPPTRPPPHHCNML